MLVFAATKGRVVQVPDPAAPVGINLIGKMDPDLNWAKQSAIVTRLMVSERSNVQYLHSMGASVYIYVFGDRIGSISLSGLAFTNACFNGAGGRDVGDGFESSPGGELVYSWYRNNRVASRQTPVRITMGEVVLEGFVNECTEDTVDPSTGLVQWNVNMATLPDDDS